MDILLRNFTNPQHAAIKEAAKESPTLQGWGAMTLLAKAGYKGSLENFEPRKKKEKATKPPKRDGRKAPRQTKRAKAPAKKRVPVRPAAKVKAPASAPAKPKSAVKPRPASSATDEEFRLRPQFRDVKKGKL